MPIHPPGKRSRGNKLARGSRKIVAFLTLTAMVDMFSVLTIFLLNYSSNAELIEVPKDVKLPEAARVKELAPSHVVIISQNNVRVDKYIAATIGEVRAQKDWMISPLFKILRREILEKKAQKDKDIRTRLQMAVKGPRALEETPEDRSVKITVQADKNTDFLTVKKVMYTVTEAGGDEINFAVSKVEEKDLESELF